MSSSQHPPTPISMVLKTVLDSPEHYRTLIFQVICDHWNTIVNNPDIVRSSAPIKLVKGTLFIGSTNPTWTYELQLMQPHLSQAIQKLCGSQSIKAFRFQHVSQLPKKTTSLPTAVAIQLSNSAKKHFQQLRVQLRS